MSAASSTSKKRRPEGRKLREIHTYALAELAVATGKTEATVCDWIAAGLPTADSHTPVLIFGWEAKNWLATWWAQRRRAAGPGTLDCFRCHSPQRPRLDSVRIAPRPGGALNIEALCIVCGTQMNRGIKPEDVRAFQDALFGAEGHEPRFIDSDNSPDNAASELPSSNVAGHVLLRRAKWLPRNGHNERLKRTYLEHLLEAEGRSEATVLKVEAALLWLDAFLDYRDFGSFTKDDAISFKGQIRDSQLALPSKKAILVANQRFLKFLAAQPGFEGKISLLTLDYLNLTMKERRAATAPERIIPCPTVEEVDAAIKAMPERTNIELRNKAVVALLALTGIRISALASLRLRHLDLQLGVHQPAAEVDTKFSKNQVACFVPYVAGWIDVVHRYLTALREAGFNGDDPLFPKARLQTGKPASFGSRELSREFMTSTQFTSHIVPTCFVNAGLPRYSPHAFRHMHNKAAYQGGRSLLFAKAVSLNLGHTNMNITNGSYGRLTLEERRDILREAASKSDDQPDEALITEFLQWKRGRR